MSRYSILDNFSLCPKAAAPILAAGLLQVSRGTGGEQAGWTSFVISELRLFPSIFQAMAIPTHRRIPSVMSIANGFSQGADLLLRVACAQPEVFDRLVFLGLDDRVLVAHEFGDLVAALKADREAEDVRLRLFWRLASANDAPNGALAAFLERDRQALVVPDSLQLRFPVLSIIGGDEGITQDELALMIHQLETHVVSGVDHFGLPGLIDVISKTIDFLDP